MTRIYAYLAALVLLTAGLWGYGHTRYEAGKAKGDARVASIEARDAAELAAQKAAASAAESRMEQANAAAERQMMQDNADADQKYKDTIAGLRAGAIRLRSRFQCPSLPDKSGAIGKPDAGKATGFDEQDAEVALGIAKEGDDAIRQLTALQAVVRAYLGNH